MLRRQTLTRSTNAHLIVFPELAPRPGSRLTRGFFQLFFQVWDDKWRGQVFALNLVKGLIASLVFLAVLVATSSLPSLSGASPLFASAFLGIVVGDCVWLAALRRLGTRRLLLFDCLRPVVCDTEQRDTHHPLVGLLQHSAANPCAEPTFAEFCTRPACMSVMRALSQVAAIAGAISLGEPLTARTAAGITLVISGVYIGSPTDQQEADRGKGTPKLGAAGLALACAHLSLDMGGQFITKTGHGNYSSLQINFLRFGSATAFLLLTKLAVYCFSSVLGKPQPTWSQMPSVEEMGRPVLSDRWRATIMATVLVTNIAPWLFVSSLIRLPLGLASTLSCLGPLYEPPLALAVGGTPMKQSAVMGGLLAVLGVAVLTLKL